MLHFLLFSKAQNHTTVKVTTERKADSEKKLIFVHVQLAPSCSLCVWITRAIHQLLFAFCTATCCEDFPAYQDFLDLYIPNVREQTRL